MKAHVQWVTNKIGVLRVGAKFVNYGDPFEASCTIVRDIDGYKDECKVLGFTSHSQHFTKEMWVAIRDCLHENGIKKAHYERVKGDSVFVKEKVK